VFPVANMGSDNSEAVQIVWDRAVRVRFPFCLAGGPLCSPREHDRRGDDVGAHSDA